MSLIDLISSEEKEMIDYFRDMAIGEATNNLSLNNVKNAMVSVESWLNYWEKAKHHNHLDSVFGKSLILKRQYKYHEDIDTVEKQKATKQAELQIVISDIAEAEAAKAAAEADLAAAEAIYCPDDPPEETPEEEE